MAADLLRRLTGLTPRALTPREVDRAGELLWSVYHAENGWTPADNPSGLRLVPGDGEAGQSQDRSLGPPRPDYYSSLGHPGRFIDDFDEQATWLGLFTARSRLVGVIRILLPESSAGIEIERYHPLPAELLLDGAEVNRMAIASDHRSPLTHLLLILLVVRTATRLGKRRLLVAVPNGFLPFSLEQLGGRPTEISFRYAPDDPDPAEVWTFELTARGALGALGRLVRGRLRSSWRGLRSGQGVSCRTRLEK